MPITFIYAVLPWITPLLLVAMLIAAASGWRIGFGLLSLNALLIHLWLVRPLAASDGRLGSGSLIVKGLLAGFILSAFIGLLILFKRAPKAYDTHHDAIAAALACGPPVLILLFGYGIFSRWDGGVVFLLLATVTLASAQQAAFPSRKAWGPRPPALCRLIGITLALVVGGSISFAYFTATVVADQAARVSQGRPYCLQSGDRAAEGLLDLSLLTFREPYHSGNGPLFLRNHGLLVIDGADGQEILSWSYRNLTFLPSPPASRPSPAERPTIVCVPKHHA